VARQGESLPLLRIKLTCTCFLCSVPHADGDSRQRVSLNSKHLRRWWILCKNLYTVREVRQKIYRQHVRWHTLSLFDPIFCVLLFHFVTVCTVKRIWVRGYVMVTFHILEKLVLDRLENPKNDREISQTPSPTQVDSSLANCLVTLASGPLVITWQVTVGQVNLSSHLVKWWYPHKWRTL